MRRRSSLGVVMALVVAVSAALGSQLASPQAFNAESPLRVTIALQTDGVELRVAQGGIVVTLEI